MKTIVPILLLSFALGTVQAAETKTPPARSHLQASDCIAISRINESHLVDARTAIVRTGPTHYLVTAQSGCVLSNQPQGLMFRANTGNTSIDLGRICGEVGETVQARNNPPCAIESVSKIDKSRFVQLTAQGERYNYPTTQPAAQPSH